LPPTFHHFKPHQTTLMIYSTPFLKILLKGKKKY
jgi:hypothetical protein